MAEMTISYGDLGINTHKRDNFTVRQSVFSTEGALRTNYLLTNSVRLCGIMETLTTRGYLIYVVLLNPDNNRTVRIVDSVTQEVTINGNVTRKVTVPEQTKGQISYESSTTSATLSRPTMYVIASLNGGIGSSDVDARENIDCDFPIFDNHTSAYNYLNEGVVDEHVLNYHPENSINTDEYYFINNSVKKDGVSVSVKSYEFSVTPSSKIYIRATSPHERNENPNATLNITEMPFKYKWSQGGNQWITANALTDTLSKYFYGETWTDTNGHVYTSSIDTNIPIIVNADDELIEKYVNGDVGNEIAVNGGGHYSSSTIGDILTETDIETSTYTMSASANNLYILSASECAKLKNYLFNTDQTVIDSLKSGLWLWGANPSEMLINYYYVPFNVNVFYDTADAYFKFGSHLASELGTHSVATNGGKTFTLFSEYFGKQYNDYRQFTQLDYDLYLPFLSFVKLDVAKYTDKTVTCKMLFDATTHSVRYLLFCNGIITDRFDTSVGIDLPIMTTDNVNKAKSDMNAIISGGNSIASGVVGTGINVATGNVGGVITTGLSTLTNVLGNLSGTLGKPNESVKGGTSNALNTFDIRYAYLRITERETIKPTNLNSVYNYPSYYIGTVNNLHGYCELADVRFNNFSGTNAELIALKNQLKTGVII